MNYFTVSSAFVSETEEKKSRFIATLVPIGEFETALAVLRTEHRKANHHVTAFRRSLGNGQIQEIGKDDGEPSGTSGMPVLKTMIRANLMNCAVIVTRYFGGTKLGTGGLARAYSAAASEVIRSADLLEWVELKRCKLLVPFDQSASYEHRFSADGLRVIDRHYSEAGCTFELEGNVALVEAIEADLSNPQGS